MANDIIGAPEPVLIKSEVFWFSPASDFELSELLAWIQWRTETEVEHLSEQFFEQLETVAGAAQLLHTSVKRTKPLSVIDAALFVNGDEFVAYEINAAWYKLNFEDVQWPDYGKCSSGVSVPRTNIEHKQDVYCFLAKQYGWTVQEIAALTPLQQHIFYMGPTPSAVVEFTSEAEYMQWMLKRGNGAVHK